MSGVQIPHRLFFWVHTTQIFKIVLRNDFIDCHKTRDIKIKLHKNMYHNLSALISRSCLLIIYIYLIEIMPIAIKNIINAIPINIKAI